MEMSDNSRKFGTNTRMLGSTEQNWCKAVASGTGITVLALQASKSVNITQLKSALQEIQNNHPILNSMLYKNTSTGSTSFIINPPIPNLHLNIITLPTTTQLLHNLMSHGSNASLSPLHLIVEHELNINEWSGQATRSCTTGGLYLWFANLYALPDEKWILVIRLHTVVCDRTTAVSLLKELREVMGGGEGGGYKEEGNMGLEELIPVGKAKKTMWEHGKDMVAYSVNSFRLKNLKFKDVKGPLHSEVVRLKMNMQETQMLLAGCKSRGIKLCGVLAAATLIAVYSSKRRPNNHRKKYGVVFLNDCRSYLQPPLSQHHAGFYHSAINTTQEVKRGENLWDLATRSYTSFASFKNNNKHFTDIADLNFLMSKAVDNPSLTPKSSLRTALVTVFEDPVIEMSGEIRQAFALDDYIGCASVHGVGPSIAIFDTVVDGQLDCLFVYPSPLHSREQMQALIACMKTSLVDGIKMEENVESMVT
ncbi:putative chloramphenicol acetyltransferase-like domain superfamily [Helianthus annuus]|uniref:Phthiocerol/phthiodiolone dimycocerosyl transferase C-terminal domain-containing protein n=1 Tax=Helianthus annuus TaxID=4232 RepID=A0A251TXW4_HELAN|nr:uncharacterized protein LOC110878762 [Helianthus annuus]KAJ0451206.1 putative chloramphenicol acetyltransferase-like domain superfamily [Helianthus annuus]KAJ0455646.1 hypothetical protein HanIR_Chr15g0753551 [Helianthus annuus]KAJ0473075.1 putative chloramphenicol acetyltransferase-like domain superfamily [Helianthus annuus]KAJ0648678.1 putative chloramphenicol acetyltransferase-like domain superfamily [Helianthus annuus]KAJ0652492.1 putative chloramphenicol acetyltransferase-like domain s